MTWSLFSVIILILLQVNVSQHRKWMRWWLWAAEDSLEKRAKRPKLHVQLIFFTFSTLHVFFHFLVICFVALFWFRSSGFLSRCCCPCDLVASLEASVCIHRMVANYLMFALVFKFKKKRFSFHCWPRISFPFLIIIRLLTQTPESIF